MGLHQFLGWTHPSVSKSFEGTAQLVTEGVRSWRETYFVEILWHSFILPEFSECLLCTRHCSRPWGYSSSETEWFGFALLRNK